MARATQKLKPSHAVKNCPATFVKKSDYQAPYTFNLCGRVGLCRIMLLALVLEAEISLKLLHDSCGLRLMPNVLASAMLQEPFPISAFRATKEHQARNSQ